MEREGSRPQSPRPLLIFLFRPRGRTDSKLCPRLWEVGQWRVGLLHSQTKGDLPNVNLCLNWRSAQARVATSYCSSPRLLSNCSPAPGLYSSLGCLKTWSLLRQDWPVFLTSLRHPPLPSRCPFSKCRKTFNCVNAMTSKHLPFIDNYVDGIQSTLYAQHCIYEAGKASFTLIL